MLGRNLAENFLAERANFWTSMEGVIHDLQHNYPAARDVLLGQLGHLSLRLYSYRQAGEQMGLGYPPNEIVRHAPPGFFCDRAQRHENFFGTEFGYACWFTQSNLQSATQDLFSHRNPLRIAELLQDLLMTWHLVEMRAFPYLPPHSEFPDQSPVTSQARQVLIKRRPSGPIRTSPRVRFVLPPPTITLGGHARRRRYRRPSPYPGRGSRGRSVRRRWVSSALENDVLLPRIVDGTSVPLPAPILPGIHSLFAPYTLPSGEILPGAPSTSTSPLAGMERQGVFEPPAPHAFIEGLNSNIGEILHGVQPLQRLDVPLSTPESGCSCSVSSKE